MDELHVLVCVKVVPKPEEIEVDPETMVLLRDGVRSEINPPDMNAIELALRIRESSSGRITILSMGPTFFEEYLRVCLAMGADDAFLLSDKAFGGADTLATTYTLAQAIMKIGSVDLVLCGEESSDGATGQVPAGLAEWLDLPLIGMVSEAEVDFEKACVRGRREFGQGYEIVEASLPTVMSVKTAANEPRFMQYPRKDWAFEEAEVTIWDSSSLGVDEARIGLKGSPTIVTGLREAESRDRRQEVLLGSPEEIAEQLHRILKEHL